MCIELLSPAGNLECLETALYFGADAVYVGGPMLQLRAGSTGFSMDTLKTAADIVHSAGKKLYVTVNAFPTNKEIDGLGDYARSLYDINVDAVIVADLGAIATIKRASPTMPIHVSTQANCVNYASALAYFEMGASRIVLGREMTLHEIAELRSKVPKALELEAFVHGAMCMSYSGRCMISSYLTGRSANRGACTQPCRWKYHLVEETRPGEFFPVVEDDRGTTILSSFDMNCIGFLDQIIEAGVVSFKIEGRMKSPYYVATVTNAYRRRIDGIIHKSSTPAYIAALESELCAVSHRAYSNGFYFGDMKRHAPDDGVYHQDCTFVGSVKELLDGGRMRIELRNQIRSGDVLEVVSPNALGLSFVSSNMEDSGGSPIDSALIPMELIDMDAPSGIRPGDILRIRNYKP